MACLHFNLRQLMVKMKQKTERERETTSKKDNNGGEAFDILTA